LTNVAQKIEDIVKMVSNFITPVISRASELGVSRFEDTDPVELRVGSSESDKDIVIQAVYRQVLGNAYVMESERLTVPESQLKSSEISVREFVREVATSELYRSRFFDSCPRYRFIELNFKHLLGRAPEGYEEMQFHSQLLDRGGFEAEINSYIDSEEYQKAFGDFIVPYYRGYKTQTGKNMVGFTYLFRLLRGAPSSDRDLIHNNRSRLNRSIISNQPSAVMPVSQVGFYGGTDVDRLLSEVLKVQTPTAQPVQTSYRDYLGGTEDYLSLQRQCNERTKQIEDLKQLLNQLRSSASIGSAYLGQWQSASTFNTSTSIPASSNASQQYQSTETYASLQRRAQEQEKTIASLQQEVAETQALATIGEARLNKWRGRFFSS
jgi:hypothetical protein